MCTKWSIEYAQIVTNMQQWEWLCRTPSIIFRLVVVVVKSGGGARVRIAEKNLCYKAAFFLITQMYAPF